MHRRLLGRERERSAKSADYRADGRPRAPPLAHRVRNQRRGWLGARLEPVGMRVVGAIQRFAMRDRVPGWSPIAGLSRPSIWH
jgi:hypothetical protein